MAQLIECNLDAPVLPPLFQHAHIGDAADLACDRLIGALAGSEESKEEQTFIFEFRGPHRKELKAALKRWIKTFNGSVVAPL